MGTPTPSLRQTLRDPVLFSRMLSIVTMDAQEIPLRLNWAQRDYLSKRTPRDLILKSRQEGFSTIVQAEAARYAYTRRANILTLMDIDANTKVMRRKQDHFYKNFPQVLEAGGQRFNRPDRNASNETFSQFDTGAIMTMSTAGRLSVSRGDSLNMIHLSEAAYYRDLYAVRLSVTQAGRPFWVVIESTANGARGDFHELCMKAYEGDPAWNLHFYPWYASPANVIPLAEGETLSYTGDELAAIAAYGLTAPQIKWRRWKQRETGYKFLQEYPESVKSAFLTSVAGMFGTLEANWGAPLNATRAPGVRYRAGIDWGQQDDYTVLSIWRTDMPVQVALIRLRHMPFKAIRAEIIKAIRYWGIDLVISEGNPPGNGQNEELISELSAARISCEVEQFILGAHNKPDLIMGYNDELQDGIQLLPIDDQKAEHLAFTARPAGNSRWVYGAPAEAGAHDDTVIANAYARLACKRVVNRPYVDVVRWGG